MAGKVIPFAGSGSVRRAAPGPRETHADAVVAHRLANALEWIVGELEVMVANQEKLLATAPPNEAATSAKAACRDAREALIETRATLRKAESHR